MHVHAVMELLSPTFKDCVISKKYRSKFLSLQTLLKKRTTFLTFYVFAHISFLRVVDLATHSI